MENSENNSNHLIPEEFKNFSTGAHFSQCIECDKDLLQSGEEYFIEKAIKTYPGFKAKDIIFEYAICMTCTERFRKQISEESMQSIARYFAENVNLANRMQIMQNHPDEPEKWMEKCLVKGTENQDLQEYQIYAHCKGDRLLTTQMPYMISGEALDEISNLLSNKTLDELDGFMTKNFGPPPELLEPIPGRRRVILI